MKCLQFCSSRYIMSKTYNKILKNHREVSLEINGKHATNMQVSKHKTSYQFFCYLCRL